MKARRLSSATRFVTVDIDSDDDDEGAEDRRRERARDQQEREYAVQRLTHAAATGNVAELTRLLDSKGEARVDAATALHSVTALHKACMYGEQQIVEVLIERGAKVDVRDVGGRTPLMLAATNGHVGLLRTLLGASAAVDARTQSGMRASLYAAAGGHMQVMKVLLQRDPRADESVNHVGDSCADLAASHGHVSMHAWLFARRAAREATHAAERAVADAQSATADAARYPDDMTRAAKATEAMRAVETAMTASKAAGRVAEEAQASATFAEQLALEQQRNSSASFVRGHGHGHGGRSSTGGGMATSSAASGGGASEGYNGGSAGNPLPRRGSTSDVENLSRAMGRTRVRMQV